MTLIIEYGNETKPKGILMQCKHPETEKTITTKSKSKSKA